MADACVTSSIELNAWKDSLSPEVDLTAATRPSALPHRLSVHLMFWWLFILLHRPFYRRAKAAGDIDHIKVRSTSFTFASGVDLSIPDASYATAPLRT